MLADYCEHILTYATLAGDKPQAFVGSRDWIGAIELGYVLDTKLGLTCKVMTVSSGAEMSTKARELAQHFDVQGTPVMVRIDVHSSTEGRLVTGHMQPHFQFKGTHVMVGTDVRSHTQG